MINTDIEQLFELLMGISFWDIVKVLVIFALFLYIIVALVIFRQVKMMAEVIDGQMNSLVKTVALIHLLGAILVFLIAVVSL